MSPERAASITRFVAPFVRPDHHAAAPGRSYSIDSLYLDNDAMDLDRASREGHRDRFKLRARRYDGQGAVFLEIKRRVATVVVKNRLRVDHLEAESLLGELESGSRPTGAAGGEFARLANQVRARPMLHVRYRRQAWESTLADTVRVTFDSELCCAVAAVGAAPHGPWKTIDVPGLILELKFTDRLPRWTRDVIERFDLVPVSIPKYCLAVNAAFGPAAAGGLVAARQGALEAGLPG